MKKKDGAKYDQKLIDALEKLPPTIEDIKHGFTIVVRNDQARSVQTKQDSSILRKRIMN